MYRLVVCVNSVRHSMQPMDATNRQHLPFFRRVMRLRHSPHHLREVPPLGPQLPLSRLSQFCPPFDPVNRCNSHSTLPVLPPCRPPSAQHTSPQRTTALGSPSAAQSSASILSAIRPSQQTQLTRNTSRSSIVSSALGSAHITSENYRPRVPICCAVACEEWKVLHVSCVGWLSRMAESIAADDCEADGDPRAAVL